MKSSFGAGRAWAHSTIGTITVGSSIFSATAQIMNVEISDIISGIVETYHKISRTFTAIVGNYELVPEWNEDLYFISYILTGLFLRAFYRTHELSSLYSQKYKRISENIIIVMSAILIVICINHSVKYSLYVPAIFLPFFLYIIILIGRFYGRWLYRFCK